MRGGGVPAEAGNGGGLCQHGLSERRARQCRRVETGKGVERAALDASARSRGVDKRKIEPGIVSHQDGALAARTLHPGADFLENALQRFALVNGRAQRVPRIDLVDLERGRFDVGALECLDVITVRGAAHQPARVIKFDHHRGDLQQRVARAVEAAGFHVDHHRQEAAEAARHSARALFVVHVRTAHERLSPARSGTSSPGLNG